MMLKTIQVIIAHLINHYANHEFWRLSEYYYWKKAGEKNKCFHFPFPLEGTDTGGFLGAGDTVGLLTGAGLFTGFDTFGALGSGVLKLMLGLAGSELGFCTGSYSDGFGDESIGFVGIG
jgi:hypothetical protein